MKKINLFEEIVVVDKALLLKALESSKAFGITYDGRVVDDDCEKALIYFGVAKLTPSFVAPQKSLDIQELLGKEYRVIEESEKVLIKASAAWQKIISINVKNADYDDTTSDGIGEFTDAKLESIGWHAADFNINYRDMVDVLERECSGVLLCIEQDEPYQFSGLGFLDDVQKSYETLFEYCQKRVLKLMEDDCDFTVENLDDDELESARFFRCT